MPHELLAKAPKFFRADVARGLTALAIKDRPPVDETGGDDGGGIIRGMAVITRGEAGGHEMWIDAEMLSQTADAINATSEGVKARFTHPSLSGDGLGKYTGRVKDAVVDGDVVRADLHLSKLSRDTPDGDLGGYLIGLAKADPAAFGNSIAFEMDREAVRAHMVENGAQEKTDDYGRKFLSGFVSPDIENQENFPHARLKTLRAVDAVDDPAANPNGLFHRGQEIAQEADALLSFGLGITKERPELVQLELDPDRVGGFIQRFLANHGLAITPKKEGAMPDPKLSDATPTPEVKPAETKPGETKPPEAKPPETKPAEPEAKPPEAKPAPAETPAPALSTGAPGTTGAGHAFLSAFGPKGGVWFAEGKTFDEANKLFTAELRAENVRLGKEIEDLKSRNKALRGEATPVSANAAPSEELGAGAGDKEMQHLTQTLGPNLAKFAVANRVKPSLN